jgi:hypothetical protein
LLLLVASPLAAQAESWNSERAIDLIARARARRALPIADSSLRSYESRAHGRVYFYLDRRGSDRRTLVKTDQIALDVFWQAPDLTKQRIIGLRDESRLPNRMRYHLDHLTVVQNEFGNAIRLGDGDEVRDVPHPAAPGSDSIYDFRLADSLTIRLPGSPEPVRAYEIEVRPKRSDRAAIVGTVYVDRASADIVRMTFTFTPVSYVDRRLDYINISLDNSLWEGRYWLPHEQSVEIRRQIPELDFIAGAVILGRFRVSNYRLNVELPSVTFLGTGVDALPEPARKAFPFPAGLYDELQEEGLAPPPEMRELRAEAARLLGLRTLSGLPRYRLSLGSVSDIFRFDRGESAYLGLGTSWQPSSIVRAELSAGFASGPEHGALSAGLHVSPDNGPEWRLDGYFNALRDVGIRQGEAGVVSTFSSLVWADDYRDPFFASGVRLGARFGVSPTLSLELGVRSERQRSASLTSEHAPFSNDSRFRPIRSIDEGWIHALDIVLARAEPEDDAAGWGGAASLDAGAFEGKGVVRPMLEGTWRRSAGDLRTHVRLRGATGLSVSLSGDNSPLPPAAQQYFVFGGRNTLPGYEYRSFAGNAFALAEAEVSRDIAFPWIRLRATAGLGVADVIEPDAPRLGGVSPLDDWNVDTTDGLRPSLGVGVGLLWDVVRIDVARGLRGGEWQLNVSVDPRLWGIL